jgi:GT2 family glycosyltransferase
MIYQLSHRDPAADHCGGDARERSRLVGARPALSIVIPTRNRRQLLLAELRALENQTLPAECYEVIVVVDGSTDGTGQAVEALDTAFSLRQIWPPGRGRAAACNAGIRAAEGEIVVLLDDDMLPSPALLEAHLQAHASGERLGVLGPVPIRLDSDARPVTRYVGRKFNQHLQKLAEGAPIGFRDLYTGNFSIRRSLLDEVGLFDEDFRIYGNEDGELGVRLLNAGVRLAYAPKAVAHQRYTKGFAALAQDNMAKGRTAVLLARKHPQALGRLKLSVRDSRKLRFARAALLRFTSVWSGTPRLVIASFEILERLLPRLPQNACLVVLDYFYWLGATAELRAGGPLSLDPGPASAAGR